MPPFVNNPGPQLDTDFLTFINEFLFNPPSQVSSARSTLRYQRPSTRRKGYRTMWRAAATSLLKKRYSSRETHVTFAEHLFRELPSQVSVDNGPSSKETYLSIADHLPSQVSLNNGHSSQTTPLPSADEPLRKLPLGVSLDEGHSSQATHLSCADQFLPSQIFLDDGPSSQATDSPSVDQLLRNLPSQGSLHHGGDSQHHTHDKIDVDAVEEAPLITPACSVKKGSASGSCSRAEPFEATSTPAIPKHSSRKPPRPPRASVSRSGSYRAIRFKTAARTATVDSARKRKQKLPKSTSSATSMWALIVTLCFAFIMIVQGFLGNNSRDFDSKAEGQPVGQGVSSVSPYLAVPSFTSESSTQTLVAEHGAGRSLDKLQKVPRDSPFMNLRRHRLRRLGATLWLLL